MDKEFSKMTNLIIRAEKTADYKNTELMTMRSFWNKYFPGCVEHNMLRVIRESADYLPESQSLEAMFCLSGITKAANQKSQRLLKIFWMMRIGIIDDDKQ